MTRLLVSIIAVAALACLWPRAATAQSGERRFEVGAQIASVASGEFEDADVGVGGRIAWHPIGLVGVEGEIDVYPGDFAGPPAFSRSRLEGLFGVTAGPRVGRVRAFAKLRPGFIRFREAPEPFACIRIFPPPLACVLASGHTSFALDIGGGLDLLAMRRTFFRVDAGDRLLRYPGPVFDRNRTRHEGGFFGHDFRLAVGGGLRF